MTDPFRPEVERPSMQRCECDHVEGMHPFGHSENLAFHGNCMLCSCKQFQAKTEAEPCYGQCGIVAIKARLDAAEALVEELTAARDTWRTNSIRLTHECQMRNVARIEAEALVEQMKAEKARLTGLADEAVRLGKQQVEHTQTLLGHIDATNEQPLAGVAAGWAPDSFLIYRDPRTGAIAVAFGPRYTAQFIASEIERIRWAAPPEQP